MSDVSSLALVAILVRIAGSILLVLVLIKQLKLRFSRYEDQLNGLRTLLIGLTLIPFLFNFLAITNNYLRLTDGMQSETLNNASFVLGAFASTATALILFIIYRNNK